MPDPTSVFDPDRLLSTLNDHGVDYLVIGGFAVAVHGYPRLTGDLDVMADQAHGNLVRLGAALAELGAELAGVDAHLLPVDPTDPDDLARGGNWTIDTSAGRIDYLPEAAGARDYPQLVADAVDVEGAPVPFRVVGIDDLVTMKLAVRREKDHLDLAALARARPELGLDDEELQRLSDAARRERVEDDSTGRESATPGDTGWRARLRAWLAG